MILYVNHLKFKCNYTTFHYKFNFEKYLLFICKINSED